VSLSETSVLATLPKPRRQISRSPLIIHNESV
jgi:hypothetical protein